MPSSSALPKLDPLYIETYLANANQLCRRVFVAQGLDGQLRTEPSHHSAQNSADVLRVRNGRLFAGGMQ